jgi:hypothetical protein
LILNPVQDLFWQYSLLHDFLNRLERTIFNDSLGSRSPSSLGRDRACAGRRGPSGIPPDNVFLSIVADSTNSRTVQNGAIAAKKTPMVQAFSPASQK